MSNTMGYFSTPTTAPQAATPVMPAAVNAQPGAPAAPGSQLVATWDTYVPTSSADPYTSGIRTAGAAMTAAYATKTAATMARWGHMLKGRSAAGLSNKIQSIKGASTMAKKAAYLDKQVLLRNQARIVKPGPFAAIRRTFLSPSTIGRSLFSSALIAIPMSLITNFLDWKAGRINEQQRNTLFIADSVGYTVTGAASTLIGGMVAATALGGFAGTAVGIVAGLGLGWVYEKFIRPRWGDMVRNALYAGPAPTPTVPQPTVPAPQPPVVVAPPTPPAPTPPAPTPLPPVWEPH